MFSKDLRALEGVNIWSRNNSKFQKNQYQKYTVSDSLLRDINETGDFAEKYYFSTT